MLCVSVHEDYGFNLHSNIFRAFFLLVATDSAVLVSLCYFSRLMTLSDTCEASLTKIQQHNVHSIFVSFFFLVHLKGIPISFRPSWIPPRSSDCTLTVPVLVGECFCQTDGKASQCYTHRLTHFPLGDFMACADIQSFITKWINVPELQFSLKKQMSLEHLIKQHTKSLPRSHLPAFSHESGESAS